MKQIDIRQQADRKAEILIYDVIGGDCFGDGLTAKGFAESLAAMGDLDEINIRINSPGGIIHEASAIYNTLNRHPARKIVDIDGIAASAAGWIAMVGDEIHMAENALFMMHNAQGFTMGDQHEHRRTIELLEKYNGTIANTFAKRTGRKAETFLKLMDNETWYTAAESLDAKLIDTITPVKRAVAAFDFSKFGYKNAPQLPLNAAESDDVTVATPESETVPVAATDAVEPVAQESRTANGVAIRLKLMELEAD